MSSKFAFQSLIVSNQQLVRYCLNFTYRFNVKSFVFFALIFFSCVSRGQVYHVNESDSLKGFKCKLHYEIDPNELGDKWADPVVLIKVKKDGSYKVHNKSELLATFEIKEKRIHGPVKFFHENRLVAAGEYKNGKIIGKWIKYDFDTLVATAEFVFTRDTVRAAYIYRDIFYTEVCRNMCEYYEMTDGVGRTDLGSKCLQGSDTADVKLLLSTKAELPDQFKISKSSKDVHYGGDAIYLTALTPLTETPEGNAGVSVILVKKKYGVALKNWQKENAEMFHSLTSFFETKNYIVSFEYSDKPIFKNFVSVFSTFLKRYSEDL